ncbi:MAG TPA: hypothetical protein PKA62_03685, partial [Thermoanaerobaculia bacterium]|nr:hypothetical protein [Thermoanaerobaculia bacterium]
MSLGLEVLSLGAYSSLLGLTPEAGLDGTLAIDARLRTDPETGLASAQGRVASLDARMGPHR